MEAQFTTLGAIVGLVIAIILIIKKVQPAYSLILGALIGGLIGGGGLTNTVNTMVSGAGSMMSSVLRILTSGILAGALIKTGSAEKIAETIVEKLGEKRAVAAIAIATMIICAVGVFVDISVITVAPIALAIGKRAGLSKSGILVAMIGGGKAGNIISPNPNTIAVSEAFEQDLTAVMMRNFVPALFALVMTVFLASMLVKKTGDEITSADMESSGERNLPGFGAAVLGPVVVAGVSPHRGNRDRSPHRAPCRWFCEHDRHRQSQKLCPVHGIRSQQSDRSFHPPHRNRHYCRHHQSFSASV